MTLRAPSSAPTQKSLSGTSEGWSGQAFGLNLEGDFPLAGLLPRSTGPSPSRVTVLRRVSSSELRKRWSPDQAERTVDRRYADGRLAMSVDVDQALGYHVHAPGYGRCLVSSHGTEILCALPRLAAWRREGLMFAQILTLAATLQGVELLHASAVALSGRTLAFVGAPGAGKTSLAAHLVARGARYVTDDVLAVEPAGNHTLAFPGPRRARLEEHELAAIAEPARSLFNTSVGRSDKIHVAINPVSGPLPLDAIYYLNRDSESRFASITPIDPDPRLLLASTFIRHVSTPERRRNELFTCAHLAQTTSLFHISIPPSVSASELAEEIGRHSHGPLDGTPSDRRAA